MIDLTQPATLAILGGGLLFSLKIWAKIVRATDKIDALPSAEAVKELQRWRLEEADPRIAQQKKLMPELTRKVNKLYRWSGLSDDQLRAQHADSSGEHIAPSRMATPPPAPTPRYIAMIGERDPFATPSSAPPPRARARVSPPIPREEPTSDRPPPSGEDDGDGSGQ